MPRQLLPAILLAVVLCHSLEARRQGIPPPAAAASAYVQRYPELARQQRLEVHYVTHHREAFWIRGATYELRFKLQAPGAGVDVLRPVGLEGSVLGDGGLDVVVESGGRRYRSMLGERPARMNIFRHGPHYYDVHVFDLQPTSAQGDTLPLRAEVVFHAYPERLYAEVRLHPTADLNYETAWVDWTPASDAVVRYVAGGDVQPQPTGDRFEVDAPPDGAYIGAVMGGGVSFGLVVGTARGTTSLAIDESGDATTLEQRFDSAFEDEAGRAALYARIVVGGAEAVEQAGQEEASPLPDAAVSVGQNAEWLGYDARRGYYTLATSSGFPVSYYYENPDYVAAAPFSISNDGIGRRIYVRHADQAYGDRLEAGVVTDPYGLALPILVQGSKNFQGEYEEPFYDPGDRAYSESYFPLVLAPGEQVALRSYHAFQHWGNHPLKQVSSLQAWMPYYQMSVGVTETTCYVPFRFGGHGGITIADLRGLSGTMWTSQPQFDNVGGHRFVHYGTGDTEHFPRYLRSKFRMTGPNMAWWGMEYVTDDDAARVQVETFEFPQQDETRNFLRMRIDFQAGLQIADARADFDLLSIDTRIQRLRYGQVGFLAEGDSLVSAPVKDSETLPRSVLLSRRFPVMGLFDVLPQSPQQGNNAVLVRRYVGQAGGRPLVDLVVSVERLGDGDLLLRLSPADSALTFQPGDFLELDLMLLPYGSTGASFDTPMRERERYGLAAPSVLVKSGTLVNDFPSVVRIASDRPTEFTVSGGYGRIPILIEGLPYHVPPVLERRGRLGWQPVQMTASGNEGHHTYLAEDGTFGFVFLVETDGTPTPFRILTGR